jgi:osmotically-inducible protein OsmY
MKPQTKPPSRRAGLTFAALLVSIPLLSGCFGAVALGTGAGVLMIADRRPSETILTDESIELRTETRINEKFAFKVHINATSFNRMLLLTGEVPTEEAKQEAEQLARSVPNVRAISNELAVAGNSGFGGRSNDAYVTSKVKARFVDANKFVTSHIKVVTEAGIVFLLGIVHQAEADAAVEIARTTAGVQKVVRVFEVVPYEQTQQMDARFRGLTQSADTKPQ